MECWLKEYIAAGKISREQGEVTIEEDYIGTYKAPTRVFTIGVDRVRLRPIGTTLIGARGRVDMEGPKGAVKFILTGKHSNGVRIFISEDSPGKSQVPAKPQHEPPEEWVWKIATPPPKVQFINLNSEAFLNAFMEVV